MCIHKHLSVSVSGFPGVYTRLNTDVTQRIFMFRCTDTRIGLRVPTAGIHEQFEEVWKVIV